MYHLRSLICRNVKFKKEFVKFLERNGILFDIYFFYIHPLFRGLKNIFSVFASKNYSIHEKLMYFSIAKLYS